MTVTATAATTSTFATYWITDWIGGRLLQKQNTEKGVSHMTIRPSVCLFFKLSEGFYQLQWIKFDKTSNVT